MSKNNNIKQEALAQERKKVSLADAIKQKLNNQKQGQSTQKSANKSTISNTKTMKSQQTKKQNNQRKRMGI